MTAIGFEDRAWDETPAPGMGRAERAHLGRRYRAALPAALSGLELALPGPVLADADDATIALARFDAELGGEIAPFASSLLRTEAASSSQIENITAGARAIAEAEAGAPRGNAAQVVANTRAMTAAIDLAAGITPPAILAVHDALMREDAPGMAGAWRTEAVWIGGRASTPISADYVAPHHSRVPEAIDDLCAFIDREDLPVLAQVAIAHAQFETIHPFPDGNGRTGRALAHSMLRSKGVTRNVTVPVSAGLLADLDGYYDGLTAYRAGAPEAIVACFARASRVAVHRGSELVADLRGIRQGWDELLGHLRADARARILAEALLSRPVVDIAAAREITGSSNADRALRTLVELNILVGTNNHKARTVLYRAPQVLAALDRYAGAMRRDR